MTRKFGLLLTLTALLTINVSAQKAVITFDEKTHDFGNIKEEDGKATYVFDFTNTGKSTLVIQRVQASCGCTTPEWTKTPVEPGKKGIITVTYNPAGRPGVFTKSISVSSNASNEMESLTIKGTVIPKSQAQSNDYPQRIKDLNIKSKTVQMNNVIKGKTQTRTIGIQNASNAPMSVVIADLPGYVKADVVPNVLKPNEEGKIDFTFDSQKITEWGPVNDDVYVILNGAKIYSDEYKLNLYANVVEDFSKMTIEEKRKSPIMEIKSTNLEFGAIKKGNKVRGKVAVKNDGQNSLELRRIVNNNSEFKIMPAKMNIRGGVTGNLKIEIDTKNLNQGEYKKTFSVLTNDPSNSYVVYTINWTVIK